MKTEITQERLKEFIGALEERKVRYFVIAGFGLDGKRGYQTRPHQDLDVLCLKDDEDKIKDIIEKLGFDIRNKFNDLYKLRREDGAKVDLCLVTLEGDEYVTYGRIAVTRFPRSLFKPQKGHIGDVEFYIAPNELLKTWGEDSQKSDDAKYAKSLPGDYRLIKKIKRTLRKDTNQKL
jgi:hypothetical protein